MEPKTRQTSHKPIINKGEKSNSTGKLSRLCEVEVKTADSFLRKPFNFCQSASIRE